MPAEPMAAAVSFTFSDIFSSWIGLGSIRLVSCCTVSGFNDITYWPRIVYPSLISGGFEIISCSACDTSNVRAMLLDKTAGDILGSYIMVSSFSFIVVVIGSSNVLDMAAAAIVHELVTNDIVKRRTNDITSATRSKFIISKLCVN
jgi:hypothetical protein